MGALRGVVFAAGVHSEVWCSLQGCTQKCGVRYRGALRGVVFAAGVYSEV